MLIPRVRHKYVIALVFSVTVLLTASAIAENSPEMFQLIRTGPGLTLHKDLFMLPVTFSDVYFGARTEAVFQMSAKYRLFETPIYFAYTQISFWQAYDENNSAPFRETDYNPELFFRTKQFPLWNGQFGADLGIEHESNGQKPPISRSWNLLYAGPYYYHSDLLVYLKLRYRIPEDEKESPDAAVGDDNPDITDYLGYSDLHIYYRFLRNHTVHLMIRGNLRTGNGGAMVMYSLPVPRSTTSFFTVRITQGYGESLVDYKKSLTRVGIGIMFAK